MAGETSRDRYLRDAGNVPIGARVLAAALLFVATNCVAFVAVVPVILSILPGLRVPLILGNLAWVAAVFSMFAAIVLGVAFVYQAPWLWRAFGTWAAALCITVLIALLALAPLNMGFIPLSLVATIGLTGGVAWVIDRYGQTVAVPPPASQVADRDSAV